MKMVTLMYVSIVSGGIAKDNLIFYYTPANEIGKAGNYTGIIISAGLCTICILRWTFRFDEVMSSGVFVT